MKIKQVITTNTEIQRGIEKAISDTKMEFYPKLLAKLRKLESGEMSLADYILEVESKVKGAIQ